MWPWSWRGGRGDFRRAGGSGGLEGGADPLLLPETALQQGDRALRGAQEMASVKLTPKEIVERLQIVEALMAEGRPVVEALRWAGMTEAAYARWRIEYAGLLRTLGPLRSGSSRKGKRRLGPLRPIEPPK